MTRHFEYLRPETIDAAIGMKIKHLSVSFPFGTWVGELGILV
jgi:hypothetical protein